MGSESCIEEREVKVLNPRLTAYYLYAGATTMLFVGGLLIYVTIQGIVPVLTTYSMWSSLGGGI